MYQPTLNVMKTALTYCSKHSLPARMSVCREIKPKIHRGLTLVELLVVIVVIAVLAALAFPMYRSMIARADSAKSLSRMKNVGQAVMAFSGDNAARLPSAFGWPYRFGIYEKPSWVAGSIGKDWADDMWIWALVNTQDMPLEAFTSPQTDKQLKSLGFGSFPAFMLNQVPTMPESAYFGNISRYIAPANTILLSQVGFDSTTLGNKSNAFCNFWGDWGLIHAVANQKLGNKTSHYFFLDGHAESLTPGETVGINATGKRNTTRWFDPSMFPNTWWFDEAACATELRRRLPQAK
jgi:prepilin-type N-terminal cleavage/methylation domain-containing protein/prepilin-type processing-associated H-X9-DG protein